MILTRAQELAICNSLLAGSPEQFACDMEAAGIPLQTAERFLTSLAVHAASRGQYAYRRDCGATHDEAFKAGQDTARKVRKSLGFTYP